MVPRRGQVLALLGLTLSDSQPPYPLTLMRQALVTSCLGSTTSTRGSTMATSLMQDVKGAHVLLPVAHVDFVLLVLDGCYIPAWLGLGR